MPKMRYHLCFLLCASSSAQGAALPPWRRDMSHFSIGTSSSSSTRASALAEKRAGWEYGPSIAGNTAFYPAGSIGGPVAKAQGDSLEAFQDELSVKNDADAKAAQASIVAVSTFGRLILEIFA